ncbi:MAG: ribonuclease HI [Bdellovibrionales bacterium]
MSKFNQILIFTDGACSGNPGPGGYGAVIVYPDGRVKELGGGRRDTTNNRMEMMAVIKGLCEVVSSKEDVLVLTDSTYVIQGATQWIFGWRKKNWLTAAGKEVSNKDLWLELDRAVVKRQSISKLSWGYVRGHVGVPGNERCDEIGVAYSKKQFIELFDGKLLDYPIAIHDIPEDLSMPVKKAESEKSSNKKKKAYSYLSLVNGKLNIDKTWPECEARVKGRSGVKFKKSISAEDEKRIIAEWMG